MDQASAIGYLLQHVSGTLSRQVDQVMQEQIGIGLAQFKILMTLQAYPEIRQRQMANHLGQTEASVSRQIKLLLERGLLVSQVNPHNRREHINIPTAKGIKMAEAAHQAMMQYVAPLADSLNDKQQKQLLEALVTMHQWTCQRGRLTSCDHPFSI